MVGLAVARQRATKPGCPLFRLRQQPEPYPGPGIPTQKNPDFGQVEADPANLNLSVYETFFEEKRPFFMEGKNIMDFEFEGNQVFYSRRIGHSPSYSPELEDNEQFFDRNQETIYLHSVPGLVESIKQAEQENDWVSEEEFWNSLDEMEN